MFSSKKYKSEINKLKKLNIDLNKQIENGNKHVNNLKDNINDFKDQINKLKNNIINLNNELIYLKKKKKCITIKDFLKLNLIVHSKIQRLLNDSHIENLTKKIQNNPQFITPFYIGILNNKKYILDGQHRFYIIKNLKSLLNNNLKLNIIYSNFTNENEMFNYFNIINDNLNININKKLNKNQIIEETKKLLFFKYKYYFKLHKRIRKPYIDQEIFDYHLNNYYESFNINNSEELINKIEKLNQKYHYKYIDQENVSGLSTIRKQILPFYLGIEKEWYNYLNTNINPDYIKKRPSISKDLRKKIWKEKIGNKESICICCKEMITERNFHLGHIIPFSLGGLTNSYNLHPICGNCNTSMSDKNMFEYIIEKKINENLGIKMRNEYENNKKLYKF